MNMTLTSNLVLRVIVSVTYLLYSSRYKYQIWCVYAFLDDRVVHTIFTTDLVLRNIVSGKISLILFEEDIPNLVCVCIFGWRSVTYYFQFTLTLTSDLISIIIVSRTYLLYHLNWESQIWCVNAS